jgi:hypothetical protein
MFSSTNDLSAFGRAIFRNTLLTPAQTRRWLKPVFFTSELVAGVGYPWGVRRIPLNGLSGDNVHRIVDAYGKAGSIGSWSSLLVLIPDYDVGITALIGGASIPGDFNWGIADAIGPVLLPALENAARQQAQDTYGGTYMASSDAHLNSSIVIDTSADRPGLGISRWISNGTDMMLVAPDLQNGWTVGDPSVRLYPTGLQTKNSDGTSKVAFKAVMEDLNLPTHPWQSTMFSTDCGTWVEQTAAVWGSMPLDQFVFHLDANGKVVSIEPLALRIQLKKTG